MIYKYGISPTLAGYGWLRGDDEYAHELALAGIKVLQRVPGLMELLRFLTEARSVASPRDVFGIRFPTPIGLAAGLDKEGVGLPFWKAVGFGFVEVGTVTPYAQPGHGRPRLFRLGKEKMLINRMGFNGPGMAVVRQNVAQVRKGLGIPVGISLGKMGKTANEDAHLDFGVVLQECILDGDFFIVNVSSPNTEGLRDLQNKQHIEALLCYLVDLAAREANRLGIPIPPLLVKTAPDFEPDELGVVLDAGLAAGISGLVIGNTTVLRPPPIPQPVTGKYYRPGGASGGDWLFNRALALGWVAKQYAPQLPLVLVGGIDSARKAAQALAIADLIEVLTGFVYQGPKLIRQIRRVRVPEPAILQARRTVV